MPELRWILLGLGALFCVGLWWWETRRRRQAVDNLKDFAPPDTDAHSARSSLRQRTPSISTQENAEAGDAAAWTGWTEPSKPNDLDAENAGLRDLSPTYGDARRIEPTLGEAVTVGDALHDVIPAKPTLDSDRGAGLQSTELDPRLHRYGADADPAPNDALQNKIISLRLLAPPYELFEGRALVSALHAAGLEHGKFSIFHKYDANGSTLFSVASMVEPGSFDLEHIDERRFRGITFFTVLEGSGETGLLAMKQTARELAERLHGTVQEES